MAHNESAETSVSLPASSNCEVLRRGADHLEFRFPKSAGQLSPGRWEFREHQELIDHLAALFGVEPTQDGVHGTAKCVGKYDRKAPDGGRAFTFGDPILDLVTDPNGTIVIGGRAHNLAAIELESPRYRSGGIRGIDLGLLGEGIRAHQVAQAAVGQGDFTLIECSEETVGLASTNPSQLDFYSNGNHLRFKAWKKNYWLYWSMGAEVETWGHDFTTARIESTYLDTVLGQTCAIVKQDSDSDSNDDYLDEYEWGSRAPQPLRVNSLCSATWHGMPFGGWVSAGPDCFQV